MAQSLAVKYRPKTWNDVTEQDAVKVILQNQLETGEIRHAYLFCGGAGTGKTTCARIFANEINKGQGNPIELDAASNNSVDDVRQISEQAKTRSLDSEYKIFILDECVTGDTEILTDSGYKRIDCLKASDKIAQYTDDGNIEFVVPTRLIKQPFCGNLECWSPRRGHTIRMTPHHVQPLFYVDSNKIKEQYIKDVKFTQQKELLVAGRGVGAISELTPLDRMAILCQADATIQRVGETYTRWTIQLAKQRKIQRFLEIVSCLDSGYTEIKACRPGCRRFAFSLPNTITKKLTDYFTLDVSYTYARAFIDECVQWDGYITDRFVQYISTDESNASFVSAMATLGGYSCKQTKRDDIRKSTYKPVYDVFMYDTERRSCQYIQKTRYLEAYDGDVFCVEVPSHKIVVRADGFTFITGNCHSLSNSAWQAMLKLIEEPPAKSIFIFCTTNPERIPKTILSRVQRYDFNRISTEGIVTRLKYIIHWEDEEILSAGGPDGALSDNCSEGALLYIARLSEGGMRDAITMLDKCLAYSGELTIDNVVKALGVADYNTMIRLTDFVQQHKKSNVLQILSEIHADGKDMKQFVTQYMQFILNCKIYTITRDTTLTALPETDEVKSFLSRQLVEVANDSKMLTKLLDMMVKLGAEIKWDSSPKAMIQTRFLLLMETNYDWAE